MIKFRRIGYSEVDILKDMTLRKADIEELKASSGLNNTWDALRYSVEYSTEWTEISYESDTKEIITVYGLGSMEGIGVPWLIANPKLNKYKKLLMRYSRKIIKEMLEQFPMIANYVDSRNTVHIHWLKRMGFMFVKEDLIINDVPFKYFYKRRCE